jgi:RNA polymerase sigma-70 factor (ECF subfamily)
MTNLEKCNAEFLALLAKHELQVAACVHALVPSWHDAEDIIQEVRLQLWQEFGHFQAGSDFAAWARTIARYAVRKYVTMNGRKPLIISTDLENAIVTRMASTPEEADRRLEGLAVCVRRLGRDALDLLQRCYVERRKIKDVANELGRSLSGAYSALSRTRRELLECMREHLRQEGNT